MTKNLTEGNPFRLILNFALPVMLGYLFQQCYNLTDTIIVGKCLGVTSLAAVGSTGSINFLIIGFVMGLCSGFAIPVAQRFGAQDFSTMRRYIANTVYLTIFFAVTMAVLTVLFCRPLLTKMQTPSDILDQADSYIRIIFAGIPLIFLYNMTSAIIRSLGDSKTPVYFLILSSIINIILDLVFIIVLGLGVRGAALATIIGQGISGVSCLIYMIKKFDIIRPNREERALSARHCATLCSVGIPMGLQYSITAIGSVILQTSVNMLGSAAVAAITAGQKIAFFFCTVFDSLGTTMATYGGQNTGAGKLDRLSKGVWAAMAIGAVYSLFCLIIYSLFGQYLISIFMSGSEDPAAISGIIANAKLFLVCNAVTYVLLAAVNNFRFMIQGMGFSLFAVIAGILEMFARTLTGLLLVPHFGFAGAVWGSPLAWVFADAFLIPAFYWCKKRLSQRIY